MGSMSWKTTTAFDPDVAVALRRAQEETLARGAYGKPYARPHRPKVRSIDEARRLFPEDGTCSVLDVDELGPKPAPGIAAPLDVGVRAPTASDIQDALPELYESLGRGEAGYVVCHENGKPVSIWFIGMSFD